MFYCSGDSGFVAKRAGRSAAAPAANPQTRMALCRLDPEPLSLVGILCYILQIIYFPHPNPACGPKDLPLKGPIYRETIIKDFSATGKP